MGRGRLGAGRQGAGSSQCGDLGAQGIHGEPQAVEFALLASHHVAQFLQGVVLEGDTGFEFGKASFHRRSPDIARIVRGGTGGLQVRAGRDTVAAMAGKKRSLWYVRRLQVVRGPYPQGQIVREALLGRIRLDDQLSRDREKWTPFADLPDMHPEKIYDADTPEGRQRLEMARLHEDERRLDRRGGSKASGPERRATDRRRREPSEAVRHREQLRRRELEPRTETSNTRWGVVVLALIGIGLAAYLIAYRPAPERNERDCAAAAAPAVNWSGCAMTGRLLVRVNLREARLDNTVMRRVHLQGANLHRADLRYADFEGALLQDADLREANLTGAILRGAELSRADLRHADLRFASLVNARLDGAKLAGARLDKAIWSDGRICAANSTGSCQ